MNNRVRDNDRDKDNDRNKDKMQTLIILDDGWWIFAATRIHTKIC